MSDAAAPPKEPPWLVVPLRTWLVISHLIVLLLPLIVLLGSRALAIDLRNQTRDTLKHQGVLLALHAQTLARHGTGSGEQADLRDVSEELTDLLVATKTATLAGIRIVDEGGWVIASSGPFEQQNLAENSEVRTALTGGQTGVAVRPRGPPSHSNPLSSSSRRARVRVFVAEPIALDDHIVGAVVLSRTPREEVQALWQMAPNLSWGVAAALLFTVLLALFYGYLFSRSLLALATASHQIARNPGAALQALERPRHSHVADVAHVANAVHHMASRLQERLQYISEFAGNVSHEFKTPLSTLRGTIELLRDDEDMPASQRETFLANAEHEIHRLDQMVDGLLRLARAEEGTQRAKVDLGALLETAAQRHPEVRFRGDAAPVLGDGGQLEAVLENLLGNARTYGGADAEITVTAWASDDETGFQVRDTGPGISEGNLPRVFERFFTTRREGGGTGLGLALVRAIVLAHGGRVHVESEPGNTVFHVSLPRWV